MSHEIRTPLNGVLGMTHLLTATARPDQETWLNVIRRSGESLLAILNDILDHARIEAGRLSLTVADFDLHACLFTVLEQHRASAMAQGLELRLDFEAGLAGLWSGDEQRLRQVLANLVANAVKFTERGEVVMTAAASASGVRISVRDTGIGIEADALERIFARFVQADASTTRRFGGAGLGLAISRDLVGLMGGSISVESQPAAGSVFSIDVPLAPVTTAAAPAVELCANTQAGDVCFLVAEDYPINQLLLQALLEPLTGDVHIVDDGQAAVEAFEARQFDVVLLDIQMPRLNGPDAARAMRRIEAREGRPRVPIIAVTANVMPDQIEDYFRCGIDAVVPKPIQPTTLYRAIEQTRAPVGPATVDAYERPADVARVGT